MNLHILGGSYGFSLLFQKLLELNTHISCIKICHWNILQVLVFKYNKCLLIYRLFIINKHKTLRNLKTINQMK